jgi:hypothetical protein
MRRFNTLILFSLVMSCSAFSQEQASSEDDVKGLERIYLIGNSLTWDTVPSKLDDDVKWHVDCGKSLAFIRDNPESPCVKSSTLWPVALKQTQFDLISFQPHYGTTVDQDVAVISSWIERQPNAIVVVHTGWARQESREEEFGGNDANESLFHGDVYFNALESKLQNKYPAREFRSTQAMNLLDSIAKDIAAGKAPIDSISELYRDKIHMTVTGGRYLMHNAMRKALGQPKSVKGFEKVPVKLREYLNAKLDELESGELSAHQQRRLKSRKIDDE